jgi:hypothetical protein
MSRHATIKTPFPTLEETADVLGVSVAQAERIERVLNERTRGRRLKTNGRLRKPAARYAAERASKKA